MVYNKANDPKYKAQHIYAFYASSRNFCEMVCLTKSLVIELWVKNLLTNKTA